MDGVIFAGWYTTLPPVYRASRSSGSCPLCAAIPGSGVCGNGRQDRELGQVELDLEQKIDKPLDIVFVLFVHARG